MLAAFTLFHVVLSLIGIGSGLVVMFGLLNSNRLDGWTTLFVTTTAATIITGFLFPYHGFLPSYGVGILSLIAIAIATLARYRFHLAGPWRTTYVITATIALYFNVFVLIAQSFGKVPFLKAIAPAQSDPPFLVTQLVAMILFIVGGFLAVRKFHKAPLAAI